MPHRIALATTCFNSENSEYELQSILGHVQAFGRASFPVPDAVFGFGPGANRPNHGITAENDSPDTEH